MEVVRRVAYRCETHVVGRVSLSAMIAQLRMMTCYWTCMSLSCLTFQSNGAQSDGALVNLCSVSVRVAMPHQLSSRDAPRPLAASSGAPARLGQLLSTPTPLRVTKTLPTNLNGP